MPPAGILMCASWLCLYPVSALAEESVADLTGKGCTTRGLEGLARQVIELHQVLYPDDLVDISLLPEASRVIQAQSSRVHLILQHDAGEALYDAAVEFEASQQKPLLVNSAYRTIVEQYVLQQGCHIAAAPAESSHQGGSAVDIGNYDAARATLQRHHYIDDVPGDPVHFEYRGTDNQDARIQKHAVMTFQHLWNFHHPGDPLKKDGIYGPETERRLRASPAQGFGDAFAEFCTPGCLAGGAGYYGIGADCQPKYCAPQESCFVIGDDVDCGQNPCAGCEGPDCRQVCGADMIYECYEGEPVGTRACSDEACSECRVPDFILTAPLVGIVEAPERAVATRVGEALTPVYDQRSKADLRDPAPMGTCTVATNDARWLPSALAAWFVLCFVAFRRRSTRKRSET